MNINTTEITEKIEQSRGILDSITAEIQRAVIGQHYLVNRLLMGLLCNQHLLIEGVPGLAKTLSVNSLAGALKIGFQRIQFTPDLLPADLTGTLIYNPKTGTFSTKKGPLFSNIILADEINRAPAKVQSALLEAMQERQITLGDQSIPLEQPFMVLATQNPIEQEGTYPLPEAQVDRFMMKLKIDYPGRDEELKIIQMMGKTSPEQLINPVAGADEIFKLRELLDIIYIDEKIEEYIVDLIRATRNPEDSGLNINQLIHYGASPRGSIFLSLASKANALLGGRGYVLPEDVKAVGMDVLRHRVIVSYEAEAEGKTSEDVISSIFEAVKVP